MFVYCTYRNYMFICTCTPENQSDILDGRDSASLESAKVSIYKAAHYGARGQFEAQILQLLSSLSLNYLLNSQEKSIVKELF
jgi:hypothetical protein